MKIAKVLMVALAVSLCGATVNAQDDCSTAVVIPCGGSGILDLTATSNHTGNDVLIHCPNVACAPFDWLCNTDADCLDAQCDGSPCVDECPDGDCDEGVCVGGANDTLACVNDMSCDGGANDGGNCDPRCILGANDAWATFVATDTSARIRTDLNSVGTDSEYSVYEVDNSDIAGGSGCNEAGWTLIGCSSDDASVGSPWNGDITVSGLTPGDTYLIQLNSWYGMADAVYEVNIDCPTVGTVCGDGITSWEEGDEECDGDDTDNCLLTCEADCTCTPVPTPMLPMWGLVGLALMLILGGAAVFGRGRAVQA